MKARMIFAANPYQARTIAQAQYATNKGEKAKAEAQYSKAGGSNAKKAASVLR